MSSFKTGDKVWVLCDFVRDDQDGTYKISYKAFGAFWVVDTHCRPVEAVAKESLTTKSNCPEIPDGSSDPINPAHYKQLPAEAIEIIMAAIAKAPSNQAAFLQGQVIKYMLRCWSKKGIEDLRKAKWYLDRLIKDVGE